MDLDELYESPRKGLRMNKRDPGSAPADPRLVINEPGALCPQVVERFVDIGYGESDVMHALASRGDKATHRRIVTEWPEQLDEGTSDCDHRLLDTLLLHDFAIQRLGTKQPLVGGERIIQVPDCERNMVEVVGKHQSTS
jgi:hypothetical protein